MLFTSLLNFVGRGKVIQVRIHGYAGTQWCQWRTHTAAQMF